MRLWPNISLLLAHRLRRWSNGKPMLGQHLMYAGMSFLPLAPHDLQDVLVFCGWGDYTGRKSTEPDFGRPRQHTAVCPLPTPHT